ncbi:hypothetical protein AHMF7605_07570 [Adhaeribacter arboris]|uniref:Outer membrane protein beta-barrel domain-containing protein n=2 Tax=Adhaeribacter arboris TaxID=2072846 RepID=A0A2T2YD05_9BACT|nr:hypothetical protein AHMF7605_07570 [Adhaeribacter arboris]
MPEEEELDNMFRQAAESFQPEFEPEAWQEMEKKLDAADRPKPAYATWMKRSVLVFLLLVSGWLVYHFVDRESNLNKEESEIQAEKPVVVTSPKLANKVKPTINFDKEAIKSSTENSRASASLPKVKEQKKGETQILGQVNGVTAKQKIATYSRNTNRVNKISGVRNKVGAKSAGENNTSSTNTPNDRALTFNNNQQKPETKALEADSLNNNLNVVVAADSIQQPTKAVIQSQKPVLDSAQLQAVADSAIRKTSKRFISKLGLTLVLGPDFSTVGFVKPEKASTNIGVILSYQVSKRWTIATGLVRARKVYGAKLEDYHPGPNYWQPGAHLPDDINAVCKVLDIPLNVRYSFLALPTHVAYVQTGLSSYIMLHEDYRYYYENYGNPYSKHWIVANQNRHFFQVLNLSAGYSRQMSRGISLGAEPFVKIPLSGIGAGKVNLTSMGIFFNVGYSFH